MSDFTPEELALAMHAWIEAQGHGQVLVREGDVLLYVSRNCQYCKHEGSDHTKGCFPSSSIGCHKHFEYYKGENVLLKICRNCRFFRTEETKNCSSATSSCGKYEREDGPRKGAKRF